VVGGLAGVLIGQNTAHGSPQRAGFIQGGGGFRGGPGPGQGAPDGGPNGGANRAPAGGGFTAGTITAIDGDTLTVKLPDGTTVKVTTSDSTKVTTTATSSVSKLKTGDKVTVIGRKDASGDLDAATIAEGQSGFGAFRGGAGGQGRDGTGSGD
jgi:preprotein translocase subunit YajC